MTRYMRWLESERGLALRRLRRRCGSWSTEDLEAFWASIWEFFDVQASYDEVLADASMPGAKWFTGAELSYPEHIFRDRPGDRVAIRHASELRDLGEWTWDELREQTARIAAGLKAMGIERGDRVVAYMPNIPETIAAFFATASLGAVWSSCSPDFGARSRRRPLRPDRAEGAADRRRLPLRRQGPRPQRADRAASRARCPRSSAP